MLRKMAEKKYTAQQLRLTNEEIIEKFAIYWAEVDAAMKRVQAQDRIIDLWINKCVKAEKANKDLQNQINALYFVCILIICTTWLGFWIVTS